MGRQLVERYTASRPRLGEHLDVIKFACKEFWGELFEKQVSGHLHHPLLIEQTM